MNKFAILLCAVFLFGCSNSHRDTSVETKSFLLNAEDFDLATITSLVRDNKVAGGEELEKLVNGDNGINNVDLDGDGQIDYIRVVESRPGDSIVLDFVAAPANGEEATVSSLRFSHNTTTNQMHVSGGYPEYVRGYDSHYYNYHSPYRVGLGTAMFYSWMYRPSRVMYVPGYARPSYYSPRARYSSSQMSTRRTSYRTQTKVSPVKKAARPASYKSSKRATKTASKFKASSAKSSKKTFGSRAGKSKSFVKRDSSKTKKKATGFGAKPAKTKSKSSWGSPSKKKSSWGSSKKKSSFGSSKSRSRSRSSSRRRR